jgi:predicted MFS family arabinose efflux permease
VALLVLLAGFIWWGNRFKAFRRTTMIYMGLGGGLLMVAGGVAFNHGQDFALPLTVLAVLVAGVGLFILAGATPAALGLLADVTESYPDDRGAIMGLYSVFLGIGQIAGSLLGGAAADRAGIDGLLIGTLVLLGIALLPLWWLRGVEHHLDAPASGVSAAGA